ncbi:hypothetical protein [Pseudaestuariivita atlantica]|nr:hypothetical protein [Pseudaestuariivita atlantica]
MIRRALIITALWAGTGGAVLAHEFTVGLYLEGPGSKARLAEIVAGFLLAADERDGHAGETSDGHLGGVDVQILPLPRGVGEDIAGLYGNPAQSPDVVIRFGSTRPSDIDIPPTTPVFEAGTLDPGQDWQQSDFAARYAATYGTSPTRDAAQGYNEARRLDMAIRPLDGLTPGPAFEAAILATAGGLEW